MKFVGLIRVSNMNKRAQDITVQCKINKLLQISSIRDIKMCFSLNRVWLFNILVQCEKIISAHFMVAVGCGTHKHTFLSKYCIGVNFNPQEDRFSMLILILLL